MRACRKTRARRTPAVAACSPRRASRASATWWSASSGGETSTASGDRMPSYLMSDPGILRLLLASGMNPDLPNWQLATPLHDLCGRDIAVGPPSSCGIRDDLARRRGHDLRKGRGLPFKTPLAWAARHDLPDMVELLLARGAPDQPSRRRADRPHARVGDQTRVCHIAQTLRKAGATHDLQPLID